MSKLELSDHPARAIIQNEIHARSIRILKTSERVRRLVFVLARGATEMSETFQKFREFCTAESISPPKSDTRLHSFFVGKNAVTWEFHTEFITVTWYGDMKDTNNWPDDIGLQLLARAELLCAMRIDMISGHEVPERLLRGFKANSLCLVSVQQEAGQIATDFVLNDDEFMRFELACGSLSDLRRSIIVRRLLEIETYRNVALLGLPLARQLSPDLHDAEAELTAVVDTFPAANSVELVQSSLDALHALSVRTGQLSERLGYRFAASAAYGEILWDRLHSLNEEPTSKGLTISNYLRSRVKPALSTFAAMEKRLNILSLKIDRAIGLLNVRIGLELQTQNKSLLDSIAKTAKGQFQLQRTVEGLSTVAISYYMLGIIGYMSGWIFERLHLDKALALSISAPVVVALVWLMVRKIRRAHETQ